MQILSLVFGVLIFAPADEPTTTRDGREVPSTKILSQSLAHLRQQYANGAKVIVI
jgi:hypothetical protein